MENKFIWTTKLDYSSRKMRYFPLVFFCKRRLSKAVWFQLSTIYGFDLRRIPSLCNVFRTFAVTETDAYAITFACFVAIGFKVQDASTISNKIKALYTLCEHRLSTQKHYNFGLKNISNVLRALRSQVSRSGGEIINPFGVVVTVLKQTNVPQLVAEDAVSFVSFLGEIFHGLSDGFAPRVQDIELSVRIRAAADGFCQTTMWIDAILDLHEMCSTRQVVILCGPTCSGKTALVTTLCGALSSSGQKQQMYRIYPKAMSASHLFGCFALETNQWNDGVFSALWRSKATKHEESSFWICLDGPIDPVWSEGLSSILDEQVHFS